MIEFDGPVCRDLGAALRREWLETNGIGGFASSTITGTNTRRYHGLLTAALHPPVGRNVLLSKLEETLSERRDASNSRSISIRARCIRRAIVSEELSAGPFPDLHV